MGVKFTNNAETTLASGINNSATSMTVASSSTFPSISGSNYFYATLDDLTNNEVVKVTAVSGTTWTIVRAQDDTSARAFSSSDIVELRLNVALLEDALGDAATFARDSFTGDGSDTTFTLSQTAASENNLIVFIEGVFQTQSAYSLSGTTLTFSAAPASSREIIVYSTQALSAGTVTTAAIVDVNVTTAKIADDAVTAAKLASDAVVTASIVDANVTTAKLAADAVTAAKLADDAVVTANITDDNVTQAKIADDAVGPNQLASSAVVTASIVADAVTTAKIADDQVTAAKIADNSITNALMADDAIDSAEIASGAIDLAHMSVNSIDSDQYVDASIDLAHMSVNSIDSDQYVDASIDLAHMSVNSIDSDQYVDGSIDAAHLADDAVTLAKMASGTDGNIISYDASGNPVAIATGSDGQVLTSAGTGQPPAFEAASGGVPTTITVADEQTDTTCFPVFVTTTTGDLGLKTDSSFKYNPAANTFFAPTITATSGIITTVTADAATIDGAVTINESGADVDFRVESDGNAHMLFVDGGNNRVGIGSSAPDRQLHIYANAVEAALTLQNDAQKFKIGIYDFGTNEDNLFIYAHEVGAEAFCIDGSTGYVGIGTGLGAIGYNLVVASTGNSILQIRAGDTSWSSLYFGETSTAYRGIVQYNHNDDYMAIYTAANERLRISSGGRQTYNHSSTANGHANFVGEVGGNMKAISFEYQNGEGEVGYISCGASSVNYATSSDYRLKENVSYTWDATTRLKQLKPARFNWITDETNTLLEGFLAHEVSDIVPEAVHGEKDAEDMQGMDHSKLVPLLVKTIQELEARITTLEG